MEAQIVAYDKNNIIDTYVLDYSFEEILTNFRIQTNKISFNYDTILKLMKMKLQHNVPLNKYDNEKKMILFKKIISKGIFENLDDIIKKEVELIKLVLYTPLDEFNFYSDCKFFKELLEFMNKNKEYSILLLPIMNKIL